MTQSFAWLLPLALLVSACAGKPAATGDPDLLASNASADLTSSSGGDGATGTADLAAPDLPSSLDEDLATNSVDPDLASADDQGALPTDDLAESLDLPSADLVAPDLVTIPVSGDLGCNLYGGDGVPTRVSIPTRTMKLNPVMATDGTSTMVVWMQSDAGASSGYGHLEWALYKDGAVVSSGKHPGYHTTEYRSKLFYFAGKYHFHSGLGGFWRFEPDTSTWLLVTSNAGALAQSGPTLVFIDRPIGQLRATLYDGTTAGSPITISNNDFGAVAGDGAGGFAVVTVNSSNIQSRPLALITYNGVSWSSESAIATLAPYRAMKLQVAKSGTNVAVLHVVDDNSVGPTAWVGSGTTWASTQFTGLSSNLFALTANAGLFAIGGNAGFAAVYKDAAWAQQQISTSPAWGPTITIRPYGSGFVTAYGGFAYSNPPGLRVSFFDGTSWSAAALLTSAVDSTIAQPELVVAGTNVGIAWLGGGKVYASTSTGGAFTTPVQLNTDPKTGMPALALVGSDVVAAFPEPSDMKLRQRTGATTWGSAVTLPSTSLSGSVIGGVVARAATGHALAAWSQWDDDHQAVFASEWNGAAWGAPVYIGDGYVNDVAGNATGFALAWGATDYFTGYAARWTGLPSPTATVVGTNRIKLASDGTNFVAASSNIYTRELTFATSSDGETWTTPTKLPDSGDWELERLLGGPAGVMAMSRVKSYQLDARIWKTGTGWSAGTSLSASECHGAVGNDSAMVACTYSGIDTRRFADGTWTSYPLPALPTNTGYTRGSEPFALGTDGTDYRIDYTKGGAKSEIFHAGAWAENPVSSPLLTVYQSAQDGTLELAQRCGRWTLLYPITYYQFGSTQTMGNNPYPAGAMFYPQPDTRVWTYGMASWPGVSDGIWTGPFPTQNDPAVLFVALNY